MTWTAWQYRDVFDVLYDESDEDTRLAIDNRLDQLLQRGNLCGRPITAPLRDQLFELRAKTARLLFYFEPNKRMIFVVGIFKDQRALPTSAIDEAKRRRAILQSGKEKERGISA